MAIDLHFFYNKGICWEYVGNMCLNGKGDWWIFYLIQFRNLLNHAVLTFIKILIFIKISMSNVSCTRYIYICITLWLLNIAMENPHAIKR